MINFFAPVDKLGFTESSKPIDRLSWKNITMQDIYRTPFLFLQEHKNDYHHMAQIALTGIQKNNDLNLTYFSKANTDKLQKLIRDEVFYRTNKKFIIEDQDVNDLFVAMRAVYLQYARNEPDHIAEQIFELNYRVVDEVVPGIITEIKQYYGYIRDINTPLRTIDRPLNVSKKGTKTLPSVTTTLF